LRLAYAILEDVAEAILVTKVVTKARLPGAREQEIIYANGAFANLTGYSARELIGRTPRIILGPRTELSRLWEIEDALCGGKPVSGELCCYRKDGTVFWNGLSVSPVRDDRGEVTHCLWVHRDTTERKAIETRLAERALRDPLTGLPNRTLLAEVLRRALVRDGRWGLRVAVMFVDLDDFKSLNDTFGHAVTRWGTRYLSPWLGA
jgi:PAS domain S-box-containing protein